MKKTIDQIWQDTCKHWDNGILTPHMCLVTACQELVRLTDTTMPPDGIIRSLIQSLIDDGYPSPSAHILARHFIYYLAVRSLAHVEKQGRS